MSIGPITGVLQAAAGAAQATGTQSAGQSFSQILSQAVQNVTGAQQNANLLMSQYATGGNVTIDQVMIAVSQAELLTEAATSITTRAVAAYQSLMQTNIG